MKGFPKNEILISLPWFANDVRPIAYSENGDKLKDVDRDIQIEILFDLVNLRRKYRH